MIRASFWSGNTELHSRNSTQGLYREDTLGQCSGEVTNFAFLGAIFILIIIFIQISTHRSVKKL